MAVDGVKMEPVQLLMKLNELGSKNGIGTIDIVENRLVGMKSLDYRYFLLGAQYRSQVFFSWDAMESAKNARKALVKRAAQIIEASHGKAFSSFGKKAQGYIDSFKENASVRWPKRWLGRAFRSMEWKR